jgi:hypothetical protein
MQITAVLDKEHSRTNVVRDLLLKRYAESQQYSSEATAEGDVRITKCTWEEQRLRSACALATLALP